MDLLYYKLRVINDSYYPYATHLSGDHILRDQRKSRAVAESKVLYVYIASGDALTHSEQ